MGIAIRLVSSCDIKIVYKMQFSHGWLLRLNDIFQL